MLIDAHCHLANLAETMPLPGLLEEASNKGIKRFLSSALRRSELGFYQNLNDSRILFSAGIHPNYPVCDLVLDDLAALCASRQVWAIGEIGLDRYNKDLDSQRRILIDQLQLAERYGLPVVLHIVGHQQLAWEVLRQYPLRYLVHGYAGSVEGFRLLARLDSWFTVSSRILRADKAALFKAMLEHGRYLFETDITQYYVHPGEKNPLLRLLDVFERSVKLSGRDRAELAETQLRSFRELTGELS
ncbi:MAG TPA: TatD family hydrolase [Candidatus Cloacimonadota bacterium]|nr:TatD family hydrolase [Candidatus Cloacimonadota bacterium]